MGPQARAWDPPQPRDLQILVRVYVLVYNAYICARYTAVVLARTMSIAYFVHWTPCMRRNRFRFDHSYTTLLEIRDGFIIFRFFVQQIPDLAVICDPAILSCSILHPVPCILHSVNPLAFP